MVLSNFKYWSLMFNSSNIIGKIITFHFLIKEFCDLFIYNINRDVIIYQNLFNSS